MQLQGIVFIQLQGNNVVVNFQGNIFFQRTSIYSQKLYSFKEIIFVQGSIFISRKLYSFKKLSSFKENIFIQGNYIHSSSRKYVHSGKLYSFQQRCFPGWRSKIIYSTISRIKYSHNSALFRLKDEEIADVEDFGLQSHRAKNYHQNLCLFPTQYLRWNLICPPASHLYLKKLLSILHIVNSCSRYTICLLFGSRFHR